MCKVQCRICGEIGYTASPDYARCECGGRFITIPETARVIKAGWLKRVLRQIMGV